MRIVGGRWRGRTLQGPKSHAVRPTADRLRESLFNILIHGYGDPVSGARVLDLFAGTGALGLEALSRGAAFALFVDPPCGKGLAEQALISAREGGWLAPDALVVVEEALGIFKPPEGFEEVERRAYDDTEFVFLRHLPSPLVGEGAERARQRERGG